MSTKALELVAAVDGKDMATAGLLTYWTLSGLIPTLDLAEAWEAEGLDAKLLPPLPTAETALARAVYAASEPRLLGRRVKTGVWELVRETVVPTADSRQTLHHVPELRAELLQDKTPHIVSLVGESTDVDARVERVRVLAMQYRRVFSPTDISNWLTTLALGVAKGVGLRERGGFYFVPSPEAPWWRQVAGILKTCSNNVVYEIPALQTASAVEAILTGLRQQADAELAGLEEYMSRPVENVSVRGLNAAARQSAAVKEKLDHYATLLGVTLPDFTARAEALSARVVAARLAAKTA